MSSSTFFEMDNVENADRRNYADGAWRDVRQD